MKRILTLLLILGIAAQPCCKLFIVAGYLLNKEYITLNFCENKTKSEMHCNGKCHLNKQLVAQEKNENSEKAPLKEIKEILPFTPTVKNNLGNLVPTQNAVFGKLLSPKPTSFITSPFRPPTC